MEDPVPGLLLLCVTCLIVLAVMLFLSDCDLQLMWAEKFGHSTGTAHILYKQSIYREFSM